MGHDELVLETFSALMGCSRVLARSRASAMTAAVSAPLISQGLKNIRQQRICCQEKLVVLHARKTTRQELVERRGLCKGMLDVARNANWQWTSSGFSLQAEPRGS